MSRRFGVFCRFFPLFPVLLLVSFLYPSGLQAGQEQSALIHGPVVAGKWYPETAPELKKLVEEYLAKVPATGSAGRTFAIIAPHAGYMYSGQVAAYSFKAIQGQKFDSVILIGPSHFVPFRGVATYDCAGFRTPLGVVPLDNELIAALKKREPLIMEMPDAFRQEHSLEAELPFLQVVLPAFKLVPLVMGNPDITTCRLLAEAIIDCVKGRSVLIVASSDLSHYHAYDVAAEMDQRLLHQIGAMNIEEVTRCLESRKCEACGQGPITTVMLAAKKLGASRCEILRYANSGDVTGQKGSPMGVVGYGAARIFVPPATDRDRDEAEKKKVGIDLGLSKEERTALLSIAREAIEAKLISASSHLEPDVRSADTASPKLKEPRGAFVTLYKYGKLRGCIGQIEARMPLAEAVAAMAEAAAFRDPRFMPVTVDELNDLKIEISVLTALQKINYVDEIEIGKHGIVIAQNGSVGLLLPQVATEYKWDRTEFLENCCLKAGLSKDSWKKKETDIYIFSADVF